MVLFYFNSSLYLINLLNYTRSKGTFNMSTYIAYSLNEHARKNSSSGGIFYSLAEHVLSQKGIVFGAA